MNVHPIVNDHAIGVQHSVDDIICIKEIKPNNAKNSIQDPLKLNEELVLGIPSSRLSKEAEFITSSSQKLKLHENDKNNLVHPDLVALDDDDFYNSAGIPSPSQVNFFEEEEEEIDYYLPTKPIYNPPPNDIFLSQYQLGDDLDPVSKITSKKKPFSCSECGISFSTKSHLKDHYFVHSEEKPYKCKLCDHKTKCEKYLRRHYIRVHQKEKHAPKPNKMNVLPSTSHITKLNLPFTCSICDYSCNSTSRFKDHMICHSEERPFHCPLCQTTFKRERDLHKHIKTHNLEDLF